jgi:hypothetical protein
MKRLGVHPSISLTVGCQATLHSGKLRRKRTASRHLLARRLPGLRFRPSIVASAPERLVIIEPYPSHRLRPHLLVCGRQSRTAVAGGGGRLMIEAELLTDSVISVLQSESIFRI